MEIERMGNFMINCMFLGKMNLQRRMVSTNLVLFVIFLISSTLLSNIVDATPDGNNYFDTAEPINVPYSKTDSLDSTDDESDFYSLRLTSGSILITVDVPTTGDFDIYVYDWEYFNETGYAIYASETENNPESLVFTPSKEGTYFIEVYAYSGLGQYTISITSQSITTDGNDNIHSAVLKDFGTFTSEISTGEIYDYFKYNCTSVGMLSITLIGPYDSTIDFDLALYNPSFVKVAISESETSYETINYTLSQIGFYYVLVYAYSGKGAYSLNVQLNTISGEIDDDWTNARPLSIPSSITDTLSRGSDNNDHFKVNARRGDSVYLNLTSPAGADFDMYLYNEDFSILAKAENTTLQDRIFERFAADGLYYLRIYAYSGSGEYLLQTSINYAGSNGVSAYIKSNATVVKVGEPVRLDASSSIGTALSYSWDFDASDGITSEATSAVVVKSWSTAGTYIVTLDVFDRSGNTDSTTITITVMGSSTSALPEWTFMVFLNADNNLEGAGITDFNEMETIGSTSNVNIVVQIDRTPDYDSSNGDTTGVRRYFVKRDSNPSTITSPMLSYLGELNMGSGDVLADFVKWAVLSYPAKKYCLVIWDHGGGINGASYDETSGDDALEPIELKNALLKVEAEGVPKLDLIGFDACLMANIEVAYELSTTAKYMVASEETEPGDGWPYNGILGALATTPTMGPLELGKNIVDKYKEFYESAGDYKNTMCVIDLSKVNQLCAKVNVISDVLLSGLESSYSDSYVSKIKSARNSVSNYYSDTHVDLAHMIYLLSLSIDAVNSVSTDFTSLKNEVVVYNYAGSANANSKGLSIYFPKSKSPKSCTFNDLYHWDDMVNKYLSLAGSSSSWFWRGNSEYGDSEYKERNSIISGIFSTSPKPIQGTPTTLTLNLTNVGDALSNAEVEVCESIPNAKNSTVFVERKGIQISANGTIEINFNWIPRYSWEVELCARIYPAGNNQTVYATIKQQIIVTSSGPDISGNFLNDYEYAIENRDTNIRLNFSNLGSKQIFSGEVFIFDYTDRWIPIGYMIVDKLNASDVKFTNFTRAFSYGTHWLGAYFSSKEDNTNTNDWAFTYLYAFTSGVDLIPEVSIGGNLINGSISVNITAWNYGLTNADNVVVRIFEETHGTNSKRQIAETPITRVNYLSGITVMWNLNLNPGEHLINVTLECPQDAHNENNFYSRYLFVGSLPGPCDLSVYIIGLSTKEKGNHSFVKTATLGDKINIWLAINNSGPGSASIVSISGKEIGTNKTVQGGILENVAVGIVYYYTLIWTPSSTNVKGIRIYVSTLNETNPINDFAERQITITEDSGLFGLAGCTLILCLLLVIVGIVAIIIVVAVLVFVVRRKK